MVMCGVCGAESPDAFRFCPRCGGPLAARARAVEERRIVTTLFCDLVGFTALSESADPEDIDRMLREFVAVARTQIEGHGGAVEKFIGDAVVGVFGVPAAHEDDPERAVRAGLRLVEDAESLTTSAGAPMRLRVGINTGEALARLDVSPGSGEGFLTGDAVNTASRLQGIAPPMGVVVGEATYLASERVIEYEELDRVAVKGKAEPLRVFLAKSPRARLGTDVTRAHAAAFVGREVDLSILKGLFDKVLASRSPELVAVVGEPGIGKTRIVAELASYVDAHETLVTWRQGRCLPYGEGVTFWALGEIVKAHAGILETDDPLTAGSKLDAVVPRGREHEWLRQRLRPLIGLEPASVAERDESFAAWRTFLESIASADPTVLVFEDLHWADDAMLSFLEYLAARARDVPLMLVGTARPELFESEPDWPKGVLGATTITLRPLSDPETARLVSGLLDQSLLPADVQGAILERAGGNPLYAEEFVRLLKDRDLLQRKGNTLILAEGAEIPRPGSVQALIAARLDMLDPERKAMLADASVVGKVFWAGVVAEMGGREPSRVEAAMQELERKALVGRAPRSSMAGEAEYAISHALVREVAYGQIPRSARAQKHGVAAGWIEGKAGDRVEDLAEVLAGHYATAVDLARASGQADEARAFEEPALRYLAMAGERALDLDAPKAERTFARALVLAPPGHPERLAIAVAWTEAALRLGHYTEAAPELEDAVAQFRALGDDIAAARCLLTLSKVYGNMGDPRGPGASREAVRLLEAHPPGPDLAAAYTEMAVTTTVDEGKHAEAIAWADRALSLAARLGLPEPARAVGFRGMASCQLGDTAGLEDIRRGLALATERGESRDAAVLANNLAIALWPVAGPGPCLDAFREGVAAAQARGITEFALAMAASQLDALVEAGDFAQVLRVAGELEIRLEGTGDVVSLAEIRAARARVLVLRGEVAAALADGEWVLDVAGASGVPELIGLTYPPAAAARLAAGDPDGARSVLAELADVPNIRENGYYAVHLPSVVRTSAICGDIGLARRFTHDLQTHTLLAEHASSTAAAVLAESEGDMDLAASRYAEAADRWASFGVVPELALAWLGVGRCALARGRPAEAVDALKRTLSVLSELGMAPAIAEANGLLARAIALSS